MKISMGSDHAAFELKEQLKKWLIKKGYEVEDFGTHSIKRCDYPDYSYLAAKAVSEGKADTGIVICGSGQGMQMTANKVSGIRCAHCHTAEMAEISRLHNDANMLAFGARYVDFDLAKSIIKKFLNTGFEGGRHKERVKKLHSLTQ